MAQRRRNVPVEQQRSAPTAEHRARARALAPRCRAPGAHAKKRFVDAFAKGVIVVFFEGALVCTWVLCNTVQSTR